MKVATIKISEVMGGMAAMVELELNGIDPKVVLQSLEGITEKLKSKISEAEDKRNEARAKSKAEIIKLKEKLYADVPAEKAEGMKQFFEGLETMFGGEPLK
jgi:hypothetical protein